MDTLDELLDRIDAWLPTASLAVDNHDTISLVTDLRRFLEGLRALQIEQQYRWYR